MGYIKVGYVGIRLGYVESASEYVAFESNLVCMRYTFDYKGCILGYVQTTLVYVKSTLVHIASSLGYVKYVGGTLVLQNILCLRVFWCILGISLYLVVKGVPKKMTLKDFLKFFITVHSILKPVS